MTQTERKAIEDIADDMERDVAAWRFQAGHGAKHEAADAWHWIGEYALSLREALSAPVESATGPSILDLLDGFDAEIERRASELNRPRGGQTVQPGGDFVNVPPSGLGRLRWWSRAFREALGSPASPPSPSPSEESAP